MTAPRIGLALGGGIARGWAHIGVLKRLHQLGLEPDLICGTSMGALVGGFYLAGKMDELEELVRTLTRFRMVRLLDFTMPQNGIIGGRRMFREMEKLVGEIHIEDLPKPFAAVAAELATGHEIWLNRGHMLDAVRASVSLPGIFKPVKRDGRWMVDGALVNPVPVSVCRSLGARMVIAVNLTGDTMGGIPHIDRQNTNGRDLDEHFNGCSINGDCNARLGPAMRHLLDTDQEEPNFFGTMASSFTILLDRITRSRLAGDPPDLALAPRVGHIGLLDFHRAEEAIEEGVKAVDRIVPDLIEVMSVFGMGIEREFANANASAAAQGA
jgi:NTE family protein